jgi:hypothetical protein
MEDGEAQRSRSKWIVLALVPSILSNLLIAVFATMVVHTATTPDAAERGMWLVYGILCMPFVFPVYLYPLGRKYVRALHGGFSKSAVPFVLLYSAANFVVWGVGVCIVGFNMHFP